jgi:hypothetical protein
MKYSAFAFVEEKNRYPTAARIDAPPMMNLARLRRPVLEDKCMDYLRE